MEKHFTIRTWEVQNDKDLIFISIRIDDIDLKSKLVETGMLQKIYHLIFIQFLFCGSRCILVHQDYLNSTVLLFILSMNENIKCVAIVG